ncbi:hypothetical protein HI806_09100 [Ralstonia solanacearum]|nr:hypothetical protein BCR16_08795 [Ralstonia solanacearum FJAT-1458]QKL71425.1 hypothetical protein HI806_09100 [Ralstonia solanacearum]QKL76634.1 hypothetical protein HI805_09110 [Ralstonia solanacearum]QKL81838.1 hypothetical protein HI804_09110 [Ralstonia solanacearum]QKL87049.1 hypothetical protein HI803_09115 [Ralstonia solanacearum]
MMQQADLFLIPPAPHLDAARFEAWPLPGLTPMETAQCLLSHSQAFKAAIVATILESGMTAATEQQISAAIPPDWKDALGRWLHSSLADWEARQHGIEVRHVPHDGGGFHRTYCIRERRHA